MKNRKSYNNKRQPQKSGLTERKKQIYAYILAGFIIFWNIASVLGIIAFVRSFAKNGSSSEEQHVSTFQRSSIEFVSERVESSDVVATADDSGEVVINLPALSGTTFFSSNPRSYQNTCVFAGSAYLVWSAGRMSWRYTSSGIVFRDVSFVNSYYSSTYIYVDEYSSYGTPESYEQNISVYYSNNAYGFNDGLILKDISYALSYVGYGNLWEYVVTLDWYDFNDSFVRSTNLSIRWDTTSEYGGGHYSFVCPYRDFVGSSEDVQIGVPLTFAEHVWDGYANYNTLINQGYASGYSQGQQEGYNNGYNVGYSEGVDDAGEYTFFSLISAVVDAPIKAFTGLFNFEILGVNLANFFFGLLTVCVIIAVIRLFLGG